MYPAVVAVSCAPTMSPAVMVVVVKSLTVELEMKVPVEMDSPLVLIEFEPMVGFAVPLATFMVFTVAVPVSTEIDHPVIVQPIGTQKYPSGPVESVEPPVVPAAKGIDLTVGYPVMFAALKAGALLSVGGCAEDPVP